MIHERRVLRRVETRHISLVASKFRKYLTTGLRLYGRQEQMNRHCSWNATKHY